jgi:hypothetical protein
MQVFRLPIGFAKGWALLMMLTCFAIAQPLRAQEEPYFVVDNHHLQEAGTLEIANYSVAGDPAIGSRYLGSEFELEYRFQPRWASELDLQYQTTFGDSTIFTGYTWANRIRLLPRNHWVNPVLFLAWEDANGADKSIAEIEGRGTEADFTDRNALAAKTREHEIETKLILSRDQNGWDFSGNVLAAKELRDEPWQFGYALGVSRPLSIADSEDKCDFCRRNINPGLELYGGLGDANAFGFHDTAQYIAPEVSWEFRNGFALKISPSFGMTHTGQHGMLHFALIWGFPHFGRRVRSLF